MALSPEEHPVIIFYLLGLILLVMAAVGFSLIVDGHGFFSAGDSAVPGDALMDESDLSRLSSKYNNIISERSRLLLLLSNFHKDKKMLETVLERKLKLEESRNKLLISIDSIQGNFTKCQNEVRQKIWARAAGETIESLKIKGGGEYYEVSIQRVTESGLEIRHKYGFARIQASDLNDELQDRFQWRYQGRSIQTR
jgi:hypothetical protein